MDPQWWRMMISVPLFGITWLVFGICVMVFAFLTATAFQDMCDWFSRKGKK